jgi:archaellum biogenesis ATPase FlaH
MVAIRDFSLIPHSFADKILPNDLEAEQRILSTCIDSLEALNKTAQILPIEAFFQEQHRRVYRALLKMKKKEIAINIMSLREYLVTGKYLDKMGAMVIIGQLADDYLAPTFFQTSIEIVHKSYVCRQVIELGEEIATRGTENYDLTDLLDIVERKTLTLTKGCSTGNRADKDAREYDGLLTALRDIELGVSNPGLKVFRLQKLAKEYGKSFRELEHIYLKSLCAKAGGPLKTISDLDEECKSESREWLIHGLLPVGTVLEVHAMGGVGKTKLLYDLMFNLVTGSAWNGFPVTSSQRKVALYQDDESPHDMRQALRKRGFFDSPETMDNFRYRRGFTMDNIPLLLQDIKSYDPDLIVIDSLTTANRYSVFSENDTEYARPLLELTQIAADLNKTIVIIHHSNSEGESRGTKAIFNSVSEVWSIKRDTSEGAHEQEKILEIKKSRSRRFPSAYKIFFNEDDFSFSCLGEVSAREEDVSITRCKDKIVKFLSSHPNTKYEAEEIHSQVGNTLAHVRRCLSKLSGDGMISEIERKRDKVRFKLYYISFTGELKTVHDPDDDQREDHRGNSISVIDTAYADHPTPKQDQREDHRGNSTSVIDTAYADHPAPENVQKKNSMGDPKKNKTQDQRKIQQPSNTDEIKGFHDDPPTLIHPQINDDHVHITSTQVVQEIVQKSLLDEENIDSLAPAKVDLLPPVKMIYHTCVGKVKAIAQQIDAKTWQFILMPEPTSNTTETSFVKKIGNSKPEVVLKNLLESWLKSLTFEVIKTDCSPVQWISGCEWVESPDHYNPMQKRHKFVTPEGTVINVFGFGSDRIKITEC